MSAPQPSDRPPVIALTGGIATGKSTVARMLTELGAVVVDADAIVHELQSPGSPLLPEIAEAFGDAVLDADGALDRAALADIVFGDAEARRRLERLVHPRVGTRMQARAEAAARSGAPLVVLDIPVFFESRRGATGGASGAPFDAVVVVYAPEALQVERLMERNGFEREEAERRVRAQIPIEEKRAAADHVIDNSGSLEETERQVRDLYERLTSAHRQLD